MLLSNEVFLFRFGYIMPLNFNEIDCNVIMDLF